MAAILRGLGFSDHLLCHQEYVPNPGPTCQAWFTVHCNDKKVAVGENGGISAMLLQHDYNKKTAKHASKGHVRPSTAISGACSACYSPFDDNRTLKRKKQGQISQGVGDRVMTGMTTGIMIMMLVMLAAMVALIMEVAASANNMKGLATETLELSPPAVTANVFSVR